MKSKITVERNGTESPNSLYRRFSKKMKISGIMQHIKKNKFTERKMSKIIRKTECLLKIKKREAYQDKIRKGVISTYGKRK